jgi:hypothetical protein
MNRFVGWASAAVTAVLGLAACGGDSGGGGGGGIVGTWTLEAERSMAPLVDKMWDAMGPQREQLKAIPPEALKSMSPEQREQLESLSSKEGFKKLAMKEGGEMSFEVKGDGTYVGTQKKKTDTSTLTGTWAQSGSTYTFTPKSKDGKPVSGADAKAHSGRLAGGELVIEIENEDAGKMPGGEAFRTMTMYFRRK